MHGSSGLRWSRASSRSLRRAVRRARIRSTSSGTDRARRRWARERRFSQHRINARIPRRAQRGFINRDAILHELRVKVIHNEQLVREAPHPLKACDHARFALIRAVAEANHPIGGEA